MIKNSFIVVSGILFSVLFVSSFVSAHFVCGQVNDSDEGMSAAWFSVKMFYTGKPQKYTSCDVSPQDNRFCCDAEAIPPLKTWKVGKSVSAKIFDVNAGYVSDLISVVTTGEGYDVFPESKLEKVITLDNEIERLTLSNSTVVDLDLSFKEPYTKVEFQSGSNKTLLCNNCSSFRSNVSVVRGMNDWQVFASDSLDTFVERVRFASLSKLDFHKDFVCDRCSGNRIREGSVVNVSLSVVPSHGIVGMELREFVPVQWEVSNLRNATLSQYSSTHNLLVWNVSGSSITRSYTVTAPKAPVLPVTFLFKSELENIDLGVDERTVYKIIPFFPRRLSNSFFKLSNRTRGTVTSKKPLVFDADNLLIALYPKKRIRDARISLGTISTAGLSDVLEAHQIQTNLKTGDLSHVFIEFKQNKTVLGRAGYEGVVLYTFNQSWQLQEINFSYEDDHFKYYKAIVPPVSGVAFVGIKKVSKNLPSIDDILNEFFLPTVKKSWFDRPGKIQAIMRYLFFHYLRG